MLIGGRVGRDFEAFTQLASIGSIKATKPAHRFVAPPVGSVYLSASRRAVYGRGERSVVRPYVKNDVAYTADVTPGPAMPKLLALCFRFTRSCTAGGRQKGAFRRIGRPRSLIQLGRWSLQAAAASLASRPRHSVGLCPAARMNARESALASA